MIVKVEPLRAIGGFRTDLGRVGSVPLGCEETDAYIRLQELAEGNLAVFVPDVSLRHFVPASRCTWQYYTRRCFAEGLSKALVGTMGGSRAALGPERRHLMRTLPLAVGREARARNAHGIVGLAVGTATTTIGYAAGRLRAGLESSRAVAPAVARH
jgi:hypothetical protein